MEKYFVLSNDRGWFKITEFEAEDRDKANEIFEEEIDTNFSADWLLDESDYYNLKKVILKNIDKDEFTKIKKEIILESLK